MVELLKACLLENWEKFFPGSQKPEKIRVLAAKGSLGSCAGKVTFMFFKDNDIFPVAIAKTNRDPSHPKIIENEFESLSYLYAGLNDSLAENIPRPLLLSSIEGYRILFQEAIQGESLDRILARKLFFKRFASARLLRVAITWLTAVKKELSRKEKARLDDSNTGEYIFRPLGVFLENFTLSDTEKSLAGEIQSKAQELSLRGYPLCFSHGDFSPINIIFKGSSFGVIDWAQSRKFDLPLADIFFFLTWFTMQDYDRQVQGTVKLEQFRNMFFKKGSFSDVAASLIKEACEGLGIELKDVFFFFALYLIEYAIREKEQLRMQADRGFIVTVKPFDKGKKFQDASLFESGMYIHLFREFTRLQKDFILY